MIPIASAGLANTFDQKLQNEILTEEYAGMHPLPKPLPAVVASPGVTSHLPACHSPFCTTAFPAAPRLFWKAAHLIQSGTASFADPALGALRSAGCFWFISTTPCGTWFFFLHISACSFLTCLLFPTPDLTPDGNCCKSLKIKSKVWSTFVFMELQTGGRGGGNCSSVVCLAQLN